MALKRQKNNIINLAMVVMNESGDEKTKAHGLAIDQTILNGKCAGVSFRTINGAKKSAAIKLDRQACEDLREALNEVLSIEDHG